ncbi:MAG: FecR domain-containing protein [Nitrospiraceae bacterium]|nr:FecR domain-containing protein [Nitrospiraceae bacterium]
MKKVTLMLIAVCLIAFIAPVYAAVGKISKTNGEVLFRTKANIPYQKAKEGSGLEVGYWVKTGKDGWAKLLLADGSTFTLANNTELEIDKFLLSSTKKEGIFSLAQGKLRATVTKIAGQQTDYKVKSPTAVAGIKGTEFMMMSQGYANVLFGNEGTADISGAAGVDKPLTTDTMVQNTRGFTPIDPIKVEKNTPLYTAKKYFDSITASKPPKEWETSGNLPHIIARWNINYGHYLADVGKYEEALYIFQISIDLSDNSDIRSDARLERGAVYSRFLNNSEAALAEYLLVLEEYPDNPKRENALYLTGMLLYEMGFTKKAKERLQQYIKDFPSGKNAGNVETILKTIKE